MAHWGNQKAVQTREEKKNSDNHRNRRQDSRFFLSSCLLKCFRFYFYSRWRTRRKLMSDPAIKLFGKTIPLPELVGVDSSSSYTEHQHQNPVRLSDSCTRDDEEMGDSGLAGEDGGDDAGFHGGDSESEKVRSFLDSWIHFQEYP